MALRGSSLCVLALGGLVASCSGTPTGTITLVTGDETDVFTRTPAPKSIVVDKVALDGTQTELVRSELPVGTLKLPDQDRSEAGALTFAGLDPSGKTVVRGETLYVQWGALEDADFSMFVQRTGEWARMPNGPTALDPVVTTLVDGRYALGANGTATTIYDLLGLRAITNVTLPRAAKSIASVGTALVIIDENGAATFDLDTGLTYTLDAPTGGTYGEIAGGQRTQGTNGTQYVVGGTRIGGGTTPRVLLVDQNGKATFSALATAREGACATYVDGRGLVVIGGDPKAPGVEVLGPNATTASPLSYPADPVRGCGAAALDTSHVVVAGGAPGPARVIDLACTANCTPVAWPGSIDLVRAEVVGLTNDAALVIGDDAGGATHAYRASAAATTELPLKIARRGARVLRSPTGAGIVFGGGAGIEQYLE